MNKQLDEQKDMSAKQDKVIKLLLVDDGSASSRLPIAEQTQSKNSTTLIDLALTSDCSAWNRAMYFDKQPAPPLAGQNTIESNQQLPESLPTDEDDQVEVP